MKTRLIRSFALLLSIIPSLLFSQALVSKKTIYRWDSEDLFWQKDKIYYYEYDEQNRLIKQTEGDWSLPFQRWGIFQHKFWTYNQDGQIERSWKEVWNGGGESFIQSDKASYDYDQNGCLSAEYLGFTKSGNRTEYTYFNNCQLDSIIKYRCTTEDSLIKCNPDYFRKYSYEDAGKLVWMDYGVWQSDPPSWSVREKVESAQYNEKELKVEERSMWTDPNVERLKQWTHDDKGNVLTYISKKKKINEDWELIIDDRYEYLFNPKDWMIQKSRDRKFYASSQIFHHTPDWFYHYYCDGLLKEEIYEIEPGNSYKTLYEYTEGTNCEEEDTYSLAINPNPSRGEFTIHSSLLSLENSYVSIVDVLGKEVQAFKMNYRTEFLEIQLPDLPKGTYFVAVINGKESVTKKIIVLD